MLTLPPHVADDVIVVAVSADGGVTLSASAGWGQVGTTQISGTALSAAVFFKVATGVDSETCTITMGAADAIHVHMFILKDVDISTLATTATSGDGATATITFAAQGSTPYPAGSIVTVAGVTPTGYNGTYVSTGGSTTTVTYANTTTGSQTVAGTVTAQVDASDATVVSTALLFNSASITTNKTDCLLLYYIATDQATTTPTMAHTNPGPIQFLDSSDDGGTTVTTLASGAAGWYIQRAAGATPTPEWDLSATEITARFVIAFRNKSGGLIPPYIDDSAALGTRLMTGTWWASATTRNNQNFKATPLTYPVVGPQFVTTATSGNGTTATISFATQATPPFAVNSRITVAGGITPTGYAATAVNVTACTTSSVSYLNATTGAQTVPGTVGGSGTTFDAGASVVDAGFNPYSAAINSTPGASTTSAIGFELTFPTTEYDMTTGWIVGGFMASTSKMALFNQGSIAQGGTFLVAGKAFNAIATTAASGDGATATITFAAQSIAIPVGAVATVAGVTPTGYNGSYTVTGSSTTTVSYANTTTGSQTVAGTVTANQYRSFNIMARDNQDGAGDGFAVFSVRPNQTQTNFGYSGGNVLPITKIDRILILQRGQNATGAFRYMDFHLMKKVIVAGGDSTTPVDTQGLFDIGRYCRIPLLKKSGASGLVAYVPVQIGGGDAVNFQIDAGALQFPRIASTTKKEINYHGDNGAIGISYAGKSGDVIKHTNSVVTSPSPYYFEINSAATSAATWDFTGLVIVGANVTLRNVMTFNSMAFSSCPTLDFTGCTVTGATISKVPAGNDTLTTNGSTVISGSAINVTGVTAGNRWCSVASPVIFASNAFTGSSTTGHAIRITGTGTYSFVGNTFTGFGTDGSTSAAIFNDSGGAVTLNISGGGGTPTVKNGTGATTTINTLVTLTVTIKDAAGSNIQNARVAIQRTTTNSMTGAVADDGGSQTGETTAANNATTNDMTLLPTVPAVNDAYYFGAAEPFYKARVNIGQNGAGTWTITWEYYNGATWASITDISDGTNGFRAGTGNKDVAFSPPSDWATTAVQSTTAYWIRARVSAYTSITTQPLGTQSWVFLQIMNELTTAGGVATETYNYIGDETVSVLIRKSTSGTTRYFPADTTQTITSSGLNLAWTLIADTIASA